MPKSPRIEVLLVTRDEIEASLFGFLDMLRYDRAQMATCSRDYVVLHTHRRFTPDRWRSFGIHPLGPEWSTEDYYAEAERRLIEEYTARVAPAQEVK
jgi:hypothetical protein